MIRMGGRPSGGWVAVATVSGALALSLGAAPPAALADEPETVERLLGALPHLGTPTPVDLGVPGSSRAVAISDTGWVVGNTRIGDTWHGFRWKDGVVTMLDGERAVATDVNEAGQVLGTANAREGDGRVLVLWEPDGTRLDLTPANPFPLAADLNDHGLAVGSLQVDGRWVPVMWEDGVLTYLPGSDPAPAGGGAAESVNNRGEVVGYVREGRLARAVVWHDGAVRHLPRPPGAHGYAHHVNERGQVSGAVDHPTLGRRTVLWDGNAVRYLDLDVDPRYWYSQDVGENGVVVGMTADHAGAPRPVVADARGTRHLPTLGGASGAATGVHDLGVTVGFAQRAGDVTTVHAVAWVLDLPVALGERLPGVAVRGSAAYDVNARGQVVGTLNAVLSPVTDVPGQRAVLWELVPRR